MLPADRLPAQRLLRDVYKRQMDNQRQTENVEVQLFFDEADCVGPLGIIPLEGARELGDKINNHLLNWAKEAGRDHETFIVESECPRFSSGDGKGIIKSTVRGDDLYFIIDVGNYSCKYNMFGQQNSMSPDDHFQDLKRLIQAASGKAKRISVIMPLLYGGRQHRRSYRESLDLSLIHILAAGLPEASNTTSAPRPAVKSRMAATASSRAELMVSAAPSSLAFCRRILATSHTAMRPTPRAFKATRISVLTGSLNRICFSPSFIPEQMAFNTSAVDSCINSKSSK